MDFTPYIEVAKARSSQDPAHDFLHVSRVMKNAQRILEKVEADQEVVIVAILLHELFNYPKGDPRSKQSGDACAEEAKPVLERLQFPIEKRERLLSCIRDHSFSKGVIPDHIEGKIVQDADRLDAIGAIGIARLFATSAEMKRPFYSDADPFAASRPLDDRAYGLDHFYVKLNRLIDTMHTDIARQMAQQRTEFMGAFLEQFQKEID